MKRHLVVITVAVAALGAAVLLVVAVVTVRAATATANLAVSAAVSANCTITTTAVAFGAYDPIVANATANLDAAGGVTIACTKRTAATIGLNVGANATGQTRRMLNGSQAGEYLTYELYSDSGRTTVWGNTAGSWLAPAAAPSKDPRSFSVYGRVTASQDVGAGAFTDTVVATVNF